MRRGRRSAGLVAALSIAGATVDVAAAQPGSSAAACLDAIPLSAMKRVPVYAAAEIADTDPVPPVAVASMDLFTQAVAEQAGALLGAGAGQLPPSGSCPRHRACER